MHIKSCFILLLLSLSSCKTASLTDAYSNTSSSHTTTFSSDDKEIVNLYKLKVEEELVLPILGEDNSLGDLFDIALHNNPATKISWSDAKAAAATYGENLSTYLPAFGFDAEFNANREGFVFNSQGASGQEAFLMNTQIQYGPIISLSYLLFDGGTRKAKAGKYFWLLQQSNFLHNESIQSVMKTVADSYYTYISDQAQYKADIEDLENAEEAFKAATDKYKAGVYSITDMLQAKTNYLQKKVTLTNQKNTTDNSYVKLITTLSIPANSEEVELKEFPEKIAPCPFTGDLAQLINIAKESRGEFLAAKANVLSAQNDVKIAETEILPKLNLTANAGEYWYQDNYRDRGNYNILLDLSFPIFSGFYYRNLIKNKKAILEEAKSKLYSTELTIIEEIKFALNDLNASKEKIEDTKSYLEAAEIENDAMLKKYKLGIVSILDLLSAQAYLADAKSQYILAQKDYYTSIIDLSFATGMLSTQQAEIHYAK
ncbi:MAG: Outer membrane protein TolC [Chlamydiia bacterium]|nr:Outer membrane protein TolC [Chlamydiia bacterium]